MGKIFLGLAGLLWGISDPEGGEGGKEDGSGQLQEQGRHPLP